MASTIWKIPLVTHRLTQNLPEGLQPLHVADQQGMLCVWIKCDPSRAVVPSTFIVVGTGYNTPDDAIYVGTALMDVGDIVWHVFWRLG